MGGEFVEIVITEAPLRSAMLRYSVTILFLSLLVSGIAAMLVYLSLHYLFVRPLRRLTANMMAFHGDPENPGASSSPPGVRTRSATAERELAAMQSDLASMLQQKNRLAALGLAYLPRSTMTCAICWPRRSCSPTACPACPIRMSSALLPS